MKKEKWFLLQEWVAEQLKPFDSYVRSTKGSGNSTEKGDLKFSKNLGLHIECKCYNTKSPWNQDWLDKCSSEIPLHSDKTPIVVTENKEEKKVVHLYAEDFFEIYKQWYQMGESCNVG